MATLTTVLSPRTAPRTATATLTATVPAPRSSPPTPRTASCTTRRPMVACSTLTTGASARSRTVHFPDIRLVRFWTARPVDSPTSRVLFPVSRAASSPTATTPSRRRLVQSAPTAHRPRLLRALVHRRHRWTRRHRKDRPDALLCRHLRDDYDVAAITNDISPEKTANTVKHQALDPSRIRAVETGGCPTPPSARISAAISPRRRISRRSTRRADPPRVRRGQPPPTSVESSPTSSCTSSTCAEEIRSHGRAVRG